MKYSQWLDIWFTNYIEPSSKTKTKERYSEIIEKHLKVRLIDVKAIVRHFHVGYFFTTTQFFGYFLSVDAGKFFVFFEFVKERTIVAFRAFLYPFGNDAVCDFSDSASLFGRLLVSCNQVFDIPSVNRYDDTPKKWNERATEGGPLHKMARALEYSIGEIVAKHGNKTSILLIGRYSYDGETLSRTGAFEYNVNGFKHSNGHKNLN